MNKKIMILAIFLVSLLAISAVNAADNTTSDVVSVEETTDDVIEQVNDDVIEQVNDDDAYGIIDDFKNKTTYGGLIYNIGNGSNAYLNKDYTFAGAEYDYDASGVPYLLVDDRGIEISYSINIDGNGHIINAANAARFFVINANDVVLKNIVFINGKDKDWEPSIIWNGLNGTIENCTFINCSCAATGGAINWVGDKGTVTGCDFKDCYARNAGAIVWNGDEGTISNCNFDNCTPRDNAGSIKWIGDKGTVTDCTFANSIVPNGIAGAILWEGANGIVTNSNFANMSVISVGYRSGGGSIYWSGINGVISNSNFANSSINWEGGAINWHNVNGTVDNCTFFNCTAGSSGGAVYFESANCSVLNSNFIKCEGQGAGIRCDGVNAIVDNCNFFNSFTVGSGASVDLSAINCSVSNSNFVNCNSTGFGSAIYVFQSNGTVANCTFDNCSARDGGAIDWVGNYGIISGCNFTNCFSTTGDGGAVVKSGSYAEFGIFDSNFINCSSARNGGAVMWGDGNGNVYTLNNSNFLNCFAVLYGGAIYGNVKVYNSKFDECQADAYGGAMYKGAATNCTFTRNRATWGGAKHSTNDPTINCTFISNYASDYAGALYGNSVINCTFTDNSANNTGGAIQGVRDVLNCNFTNCYANVSGGAIYGVESVVGSNFENCHALAKHGGAVYMDIAGGLVDNCNFTDCSSNLSGGAVAKFGNKGDIYNSNFLNCAAGKDGGAIYHDRRGTVANCTFIGNIAVGDGGAVNGASNAVNCSFNNNSANRGGALSRSWASDCTFWFNTASADSKWNNWYDTNVPKLKLNVVDLISVYGSGDSILLNTTGEDGMVVNDVYLTIRVSKNDNSFNETYEYLSGYSWLVDLDAGNYTAKMSIEHDAYKWDNDALYKSVKLTINQRPTNITSANVSTTYGADDYLVVTLKDFEGYNLTGKTVSVDLNGINNYTTDENGQIRVPIKGVSAGNHTAVLTYDGTYGNYATSTASVNVTVEKAATLISSAAVTAVYNGGKYLYVTLKDEFGNLINGAKISVYIASSKTITTGKDGKAKLTLNSIAPKTSYTAKINFAGDDNYLGKSTTAKVTIKKATVKLTAKAKTFKLSDKTKKYTITLKDNNNKVMKSTKVTIKVNGKTYSAKTNSKGVATFKLTKLTKKGKFTALVKYGGSKYYNAKTVKPKITVK